MKKKTVYILVFAITITLASYLFFVHDSNAPPRSFDISDLIIDENDLPYGFSFRGEPARSLDDDRTPWTIGRDIDNWEFPDHGRNYIDIFQYKSEKKAEQDFDRLLDDYAMKRDDPRWNINPSHPNRYGFRCFSYTNMPTDACVWAAQYEEFTVLYSTWLAPNMTLEDMRGVAVKIEQHILNHLSE